MKVKIIQILVMLVAFIASSVQANNQWYHGSVQNVVTFGADGSFGVQLDNPTIAAQCINSRVFFTVATMGEGRTKAALSMALTALASGQTFGVVIDFATDGGGNCYIAPDTSMGALIK